MGSSHCCLRSHLWIQTSIWVSCLLCGAHDSKEFSSVNLSNPLVISLFFGFAGSAEWGVSLSQQLTQPPCIYGFFLFILYVRPTVVTENLINFMKRDKCRSLLSFLRLEEVVFCWSGIGHSIPTHFSTRIPLLCGTFWWSVPDLPSSGVGTVVLLIFFQHFLKEFASLASHQICFCL